MFIFRLIDQSEIYQNLKHNIPKLHLMIILISLWQYSFYEDNIPINCYEFHKAFHFDTNELLILINP
jgi:hypothetical protein